MAEGGLKNKTIKGVAWSAIDNLAGYAVTFVVGVILARLLSPEDYGLIGLVGIFTSISQSFINGGLGNALLRKKNTTDRDYNTVFLVNLGMSLIIYCLLFFAAPYIAVFFHHEQLSIIIRISSLTLIISSIAIVQRIQITKKIDFKSQAIISVLTASIGGIVGICLAFMNYGVWALVIQGLVSTTLMTFLMCFHNRWIPRFYFSMNSFKELFGYGSKILASSLIDAIWGQLTQVVVGKYYKAASLGQYTRALGYCNLFSSNMTNVIQRVTFPVLSEMQDDKTRMKDGYRRIIKISMLISFTCLLMLGAVSKSLIIVMIGEKWIQAANFMQMLCLTSMLYPLHALNLNMLQVMGRSDLFLVLEVIKKIIAVVPLLIGIFVDIYWMLVCGLVTSIMSYFLNSYYSGSLLQYNTLQQIKDIFPSLKITLLAAIIAFLPSLIYDLFVVTPQWNVAAFIILPIQLSIGLFILYFLFERSNLEEYCDLKGIINSGIQKIKRKHVT